MPRFPTDLPLGPATRETWFAVFEALKSRTVAGPLGIELVDIDVDRVVLEMPITDATRQPYGLLHGGVSLLLAETAASMHSTWGLDISRRIPVGIEVSGSHIGSAANGRVQARGRVLHRGQSTVVHEVEIVHLETGRILSVVRVTNLLRDVKAEPVTG